ncbi:MAG: biopolymer transporter Tol [Verrucomicrobiota bacterium]
MRAFFLLISLLILAPLSLAQNASTLDPIERTGEKQQLTISVTATEPMVEALAKRAFQLHGAFRVVSGEADVALQLRTSGSDTILFNATTGRTTFNGTVTAEDKLEATAMACDDVVERLLGIPGFFAGKLALVGERQGKKEIFVGDIFFQKMRQFTQGEGDSIGPKLSPDGTRFLYTTYAPTGFPDIYEMTLSSRRAKPFATFKGTNTGAVYSPDGSRVAMILSSSGNAELYVSGSDGRYPKRLTNNRSLEASPTWSPDGSKIVFTSDQLGKPQLFGIAASGGAVSRLPTNISRYCSEPVWNPRNSRLIAFTAAETDGFQISLYDTSTGRSEFVTTVAGDAIEPAWLNDGRHLIFTNRERGQTRLFILDTETKNIEPLHSQRFGNAAQANFVMPR